MDNKLNVQVLHALGDNYIYAAGYDTGKCFVVDPGDARPVQHFLNKSGWKLTDILITHHHFDHTAGAAELKQRTGCRIIGFQSSADLKVSDLQVMKIGDCQIQAIHTPGHTQDGICYYVTFSNGESGAVFTGDTMFVGGCGRILESNGQTMWQSLNKVAAFPDETLVYCGHNYTAENIEFALSIFGRDAACEAFLEKISNRQGPTVPSTIGLEKEINIFLRADTNVVRLALKMMDAPAWKVFAELRKRKDRF